MQRAPHKTALVLGDGGARAAYQVGVLKAVKELLPGTQANPFPILCGTSGGAINAGVLAASAENFGAGIDHLDALWSKLHADDVYRTDFFSVASTAARWAAALAFGWLIPFRPPRSLLDNAPLRRLLEKSIDFDRIETAITRHALLAVGVSCSGYDSGQSVTFFQGRADLDPWHRPQRVSAHVKLTTAHLIASSAIPFLFAPVRLHREWFGDGAIRQAAPLSPAIHLGAERMFVIGPGHMVSEDERARGNSPACAQVAGHALAGFYADSLAADLENAVRINRNLTSTPEEKPARGHTLRHIDILHISPSQRLDRLAAEHVETLPWPVKTLLHTLGAADPAGSALASCLLFEKTYVETLMNLGYADAMARGDEIRSFLT